MREDAAAGGRDQPTELPPRARGRPRRGPRLHGGRGAPPAGAGTTARAPLSRTAPPSYPRGRGDDRLGICVESTDHELSSRARGQPYVQVSSRAHSGATPAGTTRGPARERPDGVSYACGRGDDVASGSIPANFTELPPRARGRRPHEVPPGRRRRATPRRRGTTCAARSPRYRPSSYPRGRGDDWPSSPGRHGVHELPLRARGRRWIYRLETGEPGATPAGAGTTRPRAHWSSQTRSYPRGRGDDNGAEEWVPLGTELPPRARGRPADMRMSCTSTRATPAGAGTTRPAHAPVSMSWSYPRGRGDDWVNLAQPRRFWELPPRARGRPDLGECAGGEVGATPAGAGTTRKRRSPSAGVVSYPRGRGDDEPQRIHSPSAAELPPRARGRLDEVPVERPRHRATPAGAGTTSRTPGRLTRRRSYPRGRGDDGRKCGISTE